MNAIILAAGLGSRLKDITQTTHKALLPINNIPNIERTILFLKQANINDIYIITGHLSHQFEYLKDKYNCNLIYNPKYKEYNSINSFHLASPFFGDSYIIDCDVVLFSNIFNQNQTKFSKYYLIKRPKSNDTEWIPIINSENLITDIEISNREDYSLLGVSYWTEKDAILIKNELKNYLTEELLSNPKLYWDNIPIKLLSQLDIKALKLKINQGFEIDKIEDYNFIINYKNK